MAVEAVVSVVIQKVTDLLIQESVIFDKVIDQVEDIRLQLREMRGFLTDAEERHNDNRDAKNWVQEYLKTIYNVEDMVESYVLTLARKKKARCASIKDKTHDNGILLNYGLFFHDRIACQKVRRVMNRIEEEVNKLKGKRPDIVENASLRSMSIREEEIHEHDDMKFNANNREKLNFSDSFKEENSDFVGFKDEQENLERGLTEESSDRIISVVGPLGSGKSALVKRIYNRKSVSEKFVCHAWLDVSVELDFKDLLLRLWNQVNENGDNELIVRDEEKLKHTLSEFLETRKYLIVFDDIREKKVAGDKREEKVHDDKSEEKVHDDKSEENVPDDEWTKFIQTLPKVVGSKVVLITREKAIADKLDCYCLNLEPLGNRESWNLFLNKLGPGGDVEIWDPFYGELCTKIPLQENILKICKGLPLNIVLLGGFLSTKKMSCEEWTRLFHQANWDRRDTEIWLLSYTDLPAQYKLCLLYLTLFPKEFDLSHRRIVRLWLAEGFLQCPPGRGLCEDFADECFKDLVKRNFVRISKFRSDGGPRKCHLPGFLHELLTPIAQDINLFHIHRSPAKQNSFTGVRRIAEYAEIKDCITGPDLQNLRSYLSFNSKRYDNPAKEVGNFLRKITGSSGFGLLRVLDLEGVYKPTLPATLKNLFQLRYLGLRWTFLDSLPKSVGDLPYLEILDLKRTHINVLPSSIWKLKHLRHIYLPEVRLDMKRPSSQLLTLWGLIIDDSSNMKDGLDQLIQLRELGITCQLNEFTNLMNWIKKLTRLQFLSLTSKNEWGSPSNLCLVLESLSELSKLSHLKLLGELDRPLRSSHFPSQLKVLTLSISHLKEDPMEMLSQLPDLSVLRLLAKSYLGESMNCPKNGFPNLRVLKLWMLDELLEWSLEQGGMPRIRELNIRCCQKLKEIPTELLKRATLEKLILTSMPVEFKKNVQNNISEHILVKINSYDFTPLPWEKDPALWKKMN
ncbi:unnamed protein product [Amaranthus hypochondriacus]